MDSGVQAQCAMGFLNSQQLRLSAQGLYKIEPIRSLSQEGEELTEPHPSPKNLSHAMQNGIATLTNA